MAQKNVDTAYLVFTPNPNDYAREVDYEITPVWIKFGDTSDVENIRISGYDTYNPSFYALTIHAEEKEETKLGKKLEREILEKKKSDYEQVKIENRVRRDGETEWYKVISNGAYNKVKGLFEDIQDGKFHGVKGEKLGNGRVWGKVVKFTNTTPKEVVEAFEEYL